MEEVFVRGETFDKLTFNAATFTKGEYENCHFINCDFSSIRLSGYQFADCTFTGCNLSMVKLANTVFRDIKFEGCKMLGLHLDACSAFGLSFSFDDCILNHSLFYNVKAKGTIFKNTQLQEVDFTGCDLTGAQFLDCGLAGATFDRSILEKADFRTAFDYSIDPEINKMKKAKFSMPGITGLLDKYGIEID